MDIMEEADTAIMVIMEEVDTAIMVIVEMDMVTMATGITVDIMAMDGDIEETTGVLIQDILIQTVVVGDRLQEQLSEEPLIEFLDNWS